jgi:hypothetical protein
MPVELSLKLKNLISEFKSLRHLYDLGGVDERKVNETIVPKLTNDPCEISMMRQQMGSDDMFDVAFDPCEISMMRKKWVQMICLM